MQCQLPGLQFPFNVQRKNKIVVDTIMQQAIHYKVKSTSFCQMAYILLNYAPQASPDMCGRQNYAGIYTDIMSSFTMKTTFEGFEFF